MPPLDPTDFPDIQAEAIAEINDLSDAQLHAEIKKGGNSRFGAKRQPALSPEEQKMQLKWKLPKQQTQ